MNVANILDVKAKRLGKDYLHTEGESLSVLIEMKKKKVFRELNYLGIYDYCEKVLNLSPTQAFYFKSVAEKAIEVPQIHTAIVQGEITLSQARRIVPAITKGNQREWIEKAKTLPQKELEREVTVVNPKSHVREKIRPVAMQLSELKVGINPETESDLKILQDILSQKLAKPASLSDLVAWMAKDCRKRHDLTKSKAISLGNRPPKPGRQRVKISTKKEVHQRDNTQCTYTTPDGRRCTQKRWLQLHHTLEVSKGGLNTTENLKLLCFAHHQMIHEKCTTQ